jgi:hypothetical protein
MTEVFHYLKHRWTSEEGRIELIAWCGVEYPQNRTAHSFTHQVSHATCEECKDEAALHALAKVP